MTKVLRRTIQVEDVNSPVLKEARSFIESALPPPDDPNRPWGSVYQVQGCAQYVIDDNLLFYLVEQTIKLRDMKNMLSAVLDLDQLEAEEDE